MSDLPSWLYGEWYKSYVLRPPHCTTTNLLFKCNVLMWVVYSFGSKTYVMLCFYTLSLAFAFIDSSFFFVKTFCKSKSFISYGACCVRHQVFFEMDKMKCSSPPDHRSPAHLQGRLACHLWRLSLKSTIYATRREAVVLLSPSKHRRLFYLSLCRCFSSHVDFTRLWNYRLSHWSWSEILPSQIVHFCHLRCPRSHTCQKYIKR